MPAHVISSLFFPKLYGSAEMRAVFDDLNLLQKWLDFEAALARAEAAFGLVPQAAAEEISRKANSALFDTGQQALPITFGFKIAVWLSEMKRLVSASFRLSPAF